MVVATLRASSRRDSGVGPLGPMRASERKAVMSWMGLPGRIVMLMVAVFAVMLEVVRASLAGPRLWTARGGLAGNSAGAWRLWVRVAVRVSEAGSMPILAG